MKNIITSCAPHLLAVQDTIDVLSGKWKTPILVSLYMSQQMCFKELKSELKGISAKVLTKELRDLEEHKLISRQVLSGRRITVQYEITPYGKTLEDVLMMMLYWGLQHRKEITGKNNLSVPAREYVCNVRSNLPRRGESVSVL